MIKGIDDKQEIRASVAMTAYNGGTYINEQIDSIINMMGSQDELIISYDISADDTLGIIENYAKQDSRIHIIQNPRSGVESNFNNAVMHCKGKYIFLSDQDDVWINDKINRMIDYFEKNHDCVVLICDGYETTDELERVCGLFQSMRTSTNPLRNFIKGTYLGCQMAFRSSIRDKIWPVQEKPPIPHDLWLGIKGASYGGVKLLHNKLILHREHEDNFTLSSKMSIKGVLNNRFQLLKALLIK